MDTCVVSLSGAYPMPTNRLNDEEFVLVSVDRSAAPSGGEGDDWFCYRIAQGSNKIVGYRRGSQRAVKQDVQTIVLSLNERRTGKRKSPVQLPRSGKPKKTAS